MQMNRAETGGHAGSTGSTGHRKWNIGRPLKGLVDLYNPRIWKEKGLWWTLGVLVVTAAVIIVILGIWWSRSPARFDVRENALALADGDQAALVTGSYTAATAVRIGRTLLNKPGGYLSNDKLPPGLYLDNIPNWEFGTITALGAATSRPTQVCGMHWFNPPERMHLVENVRGLASSDATMATVRAVAEACGKTVVEVADRQGFVSTRILAANLIEAMRMYEEGVASASDIDAAVKLGLNHPMGPLELSDLIGNDITLAAMRSLEATFGSAKYRPASLLEQMVAEGKLGRKSGEGFTDQH